MSRRCCGAEAERLPGVSIRPGWRMTAIRDTGEGVEVDAEHDGGARRRCARAYAIGADGGAVRRARRSAIAMPARAARCATSWAAGCSRSTSAARRSTTSSRIRAPGCTGPSTRPPRFHGDRERQRRVHLPHPAPRRRVGEHHRRARPRPCSRRRWRARLDIEILARSAWNAGYTLVAEKFQRGRIFLGGDAVHLFTPTGGLGYNTAIEDAVNLGWKLAAVLNGWGGPAPARQL